MHLLDKYLFQQFFKNFFLILCALISIYFLIDFFERIDNFMDADKPMGIVIKYFLLKIPAMADMIFPVCLLLAGVITLGILTHNQEYMALKAGGVSTFRICMPLFTVSLLLTVGSLFMAEWVLPKTLVETNRIWYSEVINRIPKGIIRNGRIYHRGEYGLYSFIRKDPNSNIFEQFSYAQWDKDYNLSRYVTAQKAQWRENQWTLWDGQIKSPSFDDPKKPAVTLFKKQIIVLPDSPNDFFVPSYKVKEQSISSLLHQARLSKTDNQQAWLDFNSRLSFVFIGLPLVLLGLPVLLVLSQKWGRDLTLAIPICCGLAFAAWGWWSTSQSMARAYNINPLVSAWSIHLFVSLLGIWLLRRQDA